MRFVASYNLETISGASGIILCFTDEETEAQTGDCLRSRMRGDRPGLGPSLPVPAGPLMGAPGSAAQLGIEE